MKRIVLTGLLTFAAASGVAQPLDITGSVRIRAEFWNWFETPGHEDEYSFVGTLLRAGTGYRFNPRIDAQAEVGVPILAGLPENAIAPAPRGQLGFGGSYYAANREENDISVFVKQAFVRAAIGDATLRAGRFEFIEGTEVIPKEPVLAEIKRTRIAHRLIGNFGFTHVGRSVDGAHVSWQAAPAANITAAVFRPTAGAFDLEANPQLEVDVAYASATRTTAAMDARLFVIGYRDQRDIIDNVEMTTFGGHYIRVMPLAGGTADIVLWGALQNGEWANLDHAANAGDVELGWRRGPLTYRVGAFRGSGDDDPTDGEHGTFFQILPTARQYARFPFYNAMNSRDVFAMVTWRAIPKLTLHAEAHRLWLSESADLWYAGAGAFQEETFGFAGRPSNGSSSLARVIDINADYAMTSRTTVTAYFAIARGGGVIDQIYAGSSAAFFYFEITRRF